MLSDCRSGLWRGGTCLSPIARLAWARGRPGVWKRGLWLVPAQGLCARRGAILDQRLVVIVAGDMTHCTFPLRGKCNCGSRGHYEAGPRFVAENNVTCCECDIHPILRDSDGLGDSSSSHCTTNE